MKKLLSVVVLALSVASVVAATDANARRGRGADDPAGHVRGGGGEPPPVTSNKMLTGFRQVARSGEILYSQRQGG